MTLLKIQTHYSCNVYCSTGPLLLYTLIILLHTLTNLLYKLSDIAEWCTGKKGPPADLSLPMGFRTLDSTIPINVQIETRKWLVSNIPDYMTTHMLLVCNLYLTLHISSSAFDQRSKCLSQLRSLKLTGIDCSNCIININSPPPTHILQNSIPQFL